MKRPDLNSILGRTCRAKGNKKTTKRNWKMEKQRTQQIFSSPRLSSSSTARATVLLISVLGFAFPITYFYLIFDNVSLEFSHRIRCYLSEGKSLTFGILVMFLWMLRGHLRTQFYFQKGQYLNVNIGKLPPNCNPYSMPTNSKDIIAWWWLPASLAHSTSFHRPPAGAEAVAATRQWPPDLFIVLILLPFLYLPPQNVRIQF